MVTMRVNFVVACISTITFAAFVFATLPRPEIQYCTSTLYPLYRNESFKPCIYQDVISSVFQFGDLYHNLINLTDYSDAMKLILECTAPYPIRWLSDYSKEWVNFESHNVHRYDKNKFSTEQYVQRLEIQLSRTKVGLMRCESFDGSDDLASDVFLLRQVKHSTGPQFQTADTDFNYFFLSENKNFTGYDNQNYTFKYNFPCPFIAFNTSGVILAETELIKAKASKLSDVCYNCLCSTYALKSESRKANSSCGFLNFNLWKNLMIKYNRNHRIRKIRYHLSRLDRKASRKTFKTIPKNTSCEHQNCSANYNCSWATFNFLVDVVWKKWDCDGDHLLTCKDFQNSFDTYRSISISKQARPELWQCKASEPNNKSIELQNCLEAAGETYTILSNDTKMYDPRIGFRATIKPNYSSIYLCSTGSKHNRTQRMYLTPLDPANRHRATLKFRPDTNDHQSIACDPGRGNYTRFINLTLAQCDSVIDCYFRYTPSTDQVLSTLQRVFKNIKLKWFRQTKLSSARSLKLPFNQGYVECSGVFPKRLLNKGNDTTNELAFVKEMDFFFTGLDSEKYFLSQHIPNKAVIQLTERNEGSLTEAAESVFTCRISPFVLERTILFTLEFMDGNIMPVGLSYTNRENANLQIVLSSPNNRPNTSGTELERLLQVTLTAEVKSISCHARWLNSTEWVQDTITVSVNDPANNIRRSAILGGSLGAIALIVLLGYLFVLYWKFKNVKAIIRNLTQQELDDFFQGNLSIKNTSISGYFLEDSIGFDSSKIISPEALDIKFYEQLGHGEFGIVYKGRFGSQDVAVKSTKPKVDVNYFKAFLNELKVMVYLGEHDYIVKFHGAVVENIQKRQCHAVLELSDYGNLLDYLRDHASSFNHPALEDGLNFKDLVSFCRQIATGMEYLDSKRVIHADLAARNILVFKGNHVKITDFGLSKRLTDDYTHYVRKQKVPLPWRWMAIEVLTLKDFSTSSDVWAFGVTAWEIFSLGQTPFAGHNYDPAFIFNLENGYRLGKPEYASDQIYGWMCKCWERYPDQRPIFTLLKIFFHAMTLEPKIREHNYAL